MGYETVTRVGSAGYRVDIGVKHPHQPGTFLLGVECDGGTYSSAKTARDRLRAAVLGNLGWSMLRVWGLTWYRDPVGQRTRLLEAVGRTIVDGVFARFDNDGFIRLGPPGPVGVRRTGPGGMPRRAGAIPPVEFDQAVELVLRDSMGASVDQVLAALHRVFSWSCSGADIQAAVSKSLYRCVSKGVCAQDSEVIYRLVSP